MQDPSNVLSGARGAYCWTKCNNENPYNPNGYMNCNSQCLGGGNQENYQAPTQGLKRGMLDENKAIKILIGIAALALFFWLIFSRN